MPHFPSTIPLLFLCLLVLWQMQMWSIAWTFSLVVVCQLKHYHLLPIESVGNVCLHTLCIHTRNCSFHHVITSLGRGKLPTVPICTMANSLPLCSQTNPLWMGGRPVISANWVDNTLVQYSAVMAMLPLCHKCHPKIERGSPKMA